MIITFVIDIYGSTTNGTTVTCMRTARLLRDRGHEIRIIGHVFDDYKEEEGIKVLNCEPYKVPYFQQLILDNGVVIAKHNDKQIMEFIKGSDVVHCFMPFPLENRVRRIANLMGIPVTSAFHIQPENVCYNLGWGANSFTNNTIYRLFNKWLYRYTRHVHTPSEMMREQLEAHNYKNIIHPISNGVAPCFVKKHVEKPEEYKDKFVVMMSGRYAAEKRQDLIFKAIGASKYNSKIQLILCGQGPSYRQYAELDKKLLVNRCRFGFMKQEDLINTINYCDLYIHASDAESEAISCIEAFSCGVVPVISDSPISATNRFALDERCKFKAGDSESLRERIEYFIEHPEEKEAISKKYIEYGKTFAIDKCVDKLENMFKQAIIDDKEDQANNRAYYSSFNERRKLRKIARKLKIKDPKIYKESVK